MPTAAALTLIPITLVLVLVISAFAKLKAPTSTASSVRLLRLPGFLDPSWVSKALPPGEILLALAMLSPWLPLARLAAVAALLLFLAYLVIIARAMTFDPRPSCGCFGQIGDQRVSWKTVIRNLLLVSGAGVFAWMTWSQGSTVWSIFTDASGRERALLASAAYLALMLWFIIAPPNYGTPWWRREKKATQQHAPAPGTVEPVEAAEEEEYVRLPIPDALLLDGDRNPHTLHQLVTQRPALLVFITCGCASTRTSWERLPGWAERLPQVNVVGVETYQLGDLGLPGVASRLFYDPASRAYNALQMPGTSSAVLLGADGLIAGGPVNGNDEIEQFVEEIAEALAEAGPDAVAEPDLAEESVSEPAL